MTNWDKLILSVFEEGKGMTTRQVIEKLKTVVKMSRSEESNIYDKMNGLAKFGFIECVPDTRPNVWVLTGSKSPIEMPKIEKSFHAKCKERGIKESTVRGRIKRGWSEEDALNTPVQVQSDPTNSLATKCREHGISYGTVHFRINTLGWSEEKALNTPPRRKGKTNPLYCKCEEYGISYNLFMQRIRRGWSEEKALTTPVRPKTVYEPFIIRVR